MYRTHTHIAILKKQGFLQVTEYQRKKVCQRAHLFYFYSFFFFSVFLDSFTFLSKKREHTQSQRHTLLFSAPSFNDFFPQARFPIFFSFTRFLSSTFFFSFLPFQERKLGKEEEK